MVCIHCGQNTKVINSRPQKRSNTIWRRRQCLACQAIFTSQEAADYSLSWTVATSGAKTLYTPFSRDKLFLSIYKCLQHRHDPVTDAAALTETVIKKLPGHLHEGATLFSNKIADVAGVALNRFDHAASVQYQALRSKRS